MEKKLFYASPQVEIQLDEVEGILCGSPDVPGSGDGMNWED